MNLTNHRPKLLSMKLRDRLFFIRSEVLKSKFTFKKLEVDGAPLKILEDGRRFSSILFKIKQTVLSLETS